MARTGSTDVWRKPLVGGELAVALLNRGDQETMITASWQVLGLDPGTVIKVRDLWAHENLDNYEDHFTMKVGPHATALLKFKPEPQTRTASR